MKRFSKNRPRCIWTEAAANLLRDSGAVGFSLVEVMIALGVVVVGLLTVVALIPTGLSRESEIRERQRAMALFEALEVAVRGQQTDAQGAVHELGEAVRVEGSPITWRSGGATRNLEFTVLEGGALRRSGGSQVQEARQRLRLQVDPPDCLPGTTIPLEPLRVWASVAWPATADWVNGRWVNARGSAETLILCQPDAN